MGQFFKFLYPISKLEYFHAYFTKSIAGYQEDDINPDDVTTFQLVMGHNVLDENGIEKPAHKYVFAHDGN